MPATASEAVVETPAKATEVVDSATTTSETTEVKATDSALATGKTGMDEGKPADSTTEKPAVIYDIKAPEGVVLDDSALKPFLDLAKAEGLSNEAAQKIVDLGIKRQLDLQAASDAEQQSRIVAEEKADLELLRKDPELGGANYEQTLENASKAFNKFATKEDLEFINATRLGNRVPMIRMFNRIFHALREEIAAGAPGGEQATGKLTEDELLQKMYPKMHAEINKES